MPDSKFGQWRDSFLWPIAKEEGERVAGGEDGGGGGIEVGGGS